ncbi:hypothetical protein B0A52_07381 [Exophiala mesophila]|uniref:Putative gamma-glutamylcyclotransferase n=1 Tax=Exophiala mesophila TaxID=212818 RepID=A0A438MXA4_EXOME|nr:hypothetical protein B0A52_07381 [Exophiala mesophila]
MAPGVLHRVIHGTVNPDPWQREYLTVRPGLLYGFQRHRVRWADYPAIIPHADPTSCVRGTIVSGLKSVDLARLDLFEGDQYDRQAVKVLVLKETELDEPAPEPKGEKSHGQEVNDINNNTDTTEVEHVLAQAYVWTDGNSKLETKEWDFEEFKREKMNAWMGLANKADNPDDVEVDEGFADADRFVEGDGENNKGRPDPMGGRGVNGHISRQLFGSSG